jgi:8-oxo-dGTP pyrophosphatase MutT (NUDIX family)
LAEQWYILTGEKYFMRGIECVTLDGQTKIIDKESLTLRPAAYAIIVDNGNLLVLKLRPTGKYHLPGGGIKVGERIEDTLKRELKEETGIDIEVDELAHFKEMFFYYDPSCRAYHGLHFYYFCRPLTNALVADELVEDGAAEKPRWKTIQDLQAEDFQIDGDMILSLLERG